MTNDDRPNLPTPDEIAAWSDDERATVARALAAIGSLDAPPPPRARRRLVLAVTVGAVVLLIPWILYLSNTLRDRHRVTMWGTAWVGFDVLLLVSFALSAWTVWRRLLVAVPLLSATAVLLLVDAWFDITLSWGTRGQAASIVTALVAEIPVSVLLVLAVRTTLLRLSDTISRLSGVPVGPRSVLTRSMPTPQSMSAMDAGADRTPIS